MQEMTSLGEMLPQKVEPDSIIEALLEVRFESATLPEVFLGRIVDRPNWRGLQQRRLPAYNLPPQVRASDPDLHYVPIFELVGPESKYALRIGSSVIAYHQIAPYPNWPQFRSDLSQVVEDAFGAGDQLKVERIGLRYLNSLTPTSHYVRSIADLNLTFKIADREIRDNLTINFTTQPTPQTDCTVRIATKGMVQGTLPEDTALFVDVDVYTREGYSANNAATVIEWIEAAHEIEKRAFFGLFTKEAIDRWRAKS